MFMNPKGFTLVELVLSISILAIALTGTLLTFQTVARTSADPMIVSQSLSIARSYLTEILNKDFPSAVPCPGTPGATRSLYSDVCDYNNLTNVGAIDQSGNAISGLENYTVSVVVDTSSAVLGTLSSGTDIVRVDVSVAHPQLSTISLSGYRANF